MMNNVCSLCIPAAAGTQFTGTSFMLYVIIVHIEMALHSTKVEVHHHCEIAGSSFRSLPKIPHCWLYAEPGPCLSPSVADHPLRSAIDHCLGEPLPHQLTNQMRAHLMALKLSP